MRNACINILIGRSPAFLEEQWPVQYFCVTSLSNLNLKDVLIKCSKDFSCEILQELEKVIASSPKKTCLMYYTIKA